MRIGFFQTGLAKHREGFVEPILLAKDEAQIAPCPSMVAVNFQGAPQLGLGFLPVVAEIVGVAPIAHEIGVARVHASQLLICSFSVGEIGAAIVENCEPAQRFRMIRH